MLQLHNDCLNDIFEYLKDDIATLCSCLLVNRLWCKVSVKILWRNACNYRTSNFSTLIACLTSESKEILNKNGINISIPASKPPMFNYASFCKVLSINQVYYKIEEYLKNKQSISLQHLNETTHAVMQKICKMLMNQISSLKSLIFLQYQYINFYLLS